MLFWLSAAVALVSIAVIAALFLRHWKEVRLLDPNSIAEERERRKRDELLLQRLHRIGSEKATPWSLAVRHLIVGAKTVYHAAYVRLIKLERFYKQATSPLAILAPSVKDRVKLILDDARSLARDMKWADAERRYLEALTIDKRSFEAYKGLGILYLKQKLYPQATETFTFILKSNKADDLVFSGLAEIAEAEGDLVKAEEMRLKALEYNPRLPHLHAELAHFYVRQGKADRAWVYAQKSTELDPKSVRYLEISLETAVLLGERGEARKRYDKLRLLSQDRVKLDAYKEKIEAMPRS